jgi:hypothetical protein
MSGGYFDYQQYRIGDICAEVEQLIKNNDSEEVNHYGDPIGRGYSENTIARFKEAVYFLTVAQIYAQRIDWLVSGDDGEDSFHRRLSEEKREIDFRYVFQKEIENGKV